MVDARLIEVTQPWAAGIEGRTEAGWLVGRRDWIFVNPSDPTGLTADAIVAEAARVGARVVAVAITDLEPRHHAGVEMFAAGLALPVVAGQGAAGTAPYPVIELADGEELPFGDIPLVARDASADSGRREALRYVGPGWILPGPAAGPAR